MSLTHLVDTFGWHFVGPSVPVIRAGRPLFIFVIVVHPTCFSPLTPSGRPTEMQRIPRSWWREPTGFILIFFLVVNTSTEPVIFPGVEPAPAIFCKVILVKKKWKILKRQNFMIGSSFFLPAPIKKVSKILVDRFSTYNFFLPGPSPLLITSFFWFAFT